MFYFNTIQHIKTYKGCRFDLFIILPICIFFSPDYVHVHTALSYKFYHADTPCVTFCILCFKLFIPYHFADCEAENQHFHAVKRSKMPFPNNRFWHCPSTPRFIIKCKRVLGIVFNTQLLPGSKTCSREPGYGSRRK